MQKKPRRVKVRGILPGDYTLVHVQTLFDSGCMAEIDPDYRINPVTGRVEFTDEGDDDFEFAEESSFQVTQPGGYALIRDMQFFATAIVREDTINVGSRVYQLLLRYQQTHPNLLR